MVTVGTHDIEELRDILSRWLRNHYWVIRICPNKMMISTKKLENCILYCVIAFAQKDFSHKSDRGHFRRILTAPLSRITDTTFMSMLHFIRLSVSCRKPLYILTLKWLSYPCASCVTILIATLKDTQMSAHDKLMTLHYRSLEPHADRQLFTMTL